MIKRGDMGSKKAAIEMSMTTIIVIVLSVIFLILGLGLLRTLFGSATASVDTIDMKLRDQLTSLFADEEQPIFMKPEDGILQVRAGTTNFGFILGARTKYGNDVAQRSDLQYRLVLDESTRDSCAGRLGAQNVERWFVGVNLASSETDTITYNPISDYKFDQGFVRIQLDIPSGTTLCTQRVYYDFKDKSEGAGGDAPIGGGSFTIQVLRKSLV